MTEFKLSKWSIFYGVDAYVFILSSFAYLLSMFVLFLSQSAGMSHSTCLRSDRCLCSHNGWVLHYLMLTQKVIIAWDCVDKSCFLNVFLHMSHSIYSPCAMHFYFWPCMWAFIYRNIWRPPYTSPNRTGLRCTRGSIWPFNQRPMGTTLNLTAGVWFHIPHPHDGSIIIQIIFRGPLFTCMGRSVSRPVMSLAQVCAVH